jgi:ABC-type antimicrobial peptide transport system permease subunit
MFYVGYMLAELRRRRGRTFLTALGLAVGIGLVVTVSALSTGLDRAQAKVLKPLTGVGTDMSVSRPISISSSRGGNGAFGPRLSAKERRQLDKENGSARFGLRNLGKPGTHFSRDDFLSTSQLSFPASEVAKVARLSGVQEAAGSLTLTALHAEGTVPKQTQRAQGQFAGPPQGGTTAGPRSIDVDARTVTGVDVEHEALAPVTPGQITSGRWFSASAKREAILNVGYARRKKISVGDTIKLGGKTFEVVGLAQTPLGGQASDVYVELGVLQKLSGRVGRVNTIQVRATSSTVVDRVSREVKASFAGSSVTTAKDLADRVSGSLVDAKNLTSKLGIALEIVALLGAVLIASLLTLSSVAKRIRELGTLKALGWRQALVVRQVTGESLLQGLLGGALGIGIGVAGAALVAALAPGLKATVAQTAQQGPVFGPFGQGSVAAGSQIVHLDAPVSIGLVALAVALALLGGLVSGAVGGLRAARLRPADALRHLD